MNRYLYVFLVFHLVLPASNTHGQLFAALELGTELNNDFHDPQNGLTQPYWMSARLHAGVIVNRWRMGISESGFFTNPGSTHMEGGFIQYGIELVEIDGSKLIDLYLGVEAYTQLFEEHDTYQPIGILASTTLPSIVDLSIRAGYDTQLGRYYFGISLGRSFSKHTRPAGEKIPYPTTFSDCQYVVFNQTQVPIQTLFHVEAMNDEETVMERFKRLRTFTRPVNEERFLLQPSIEGALQYIEDMELPQLANALRLGLARASLHEACKDAAFSSRSMLPVFWKRLNDSFMLVRDSRR